MLKLHKFQSECLNEFEWFDGRVLCAIDMGLGKTIISLTHLVRHPEARPAVVVCPASVKYQWQVEAQQHTSLTTLVLSGRNPCPLPTRIPDVFVINYDILHDWVDALRTIRPKTVVIDELQYIQDHRSKRTKAVRRLCQGVKKIIALSGTPILNYPIQLWPTLNLLSPKIWASRFRFARQFCAPRFTPWGWQFRGASNTDKLNQLLTQSCMVRRRKEDVLQDLPPKIRSVLPIDIKMSEYKRAESDFLNWLAETDPLRAKKASRAVAITKIGYLLRLVAKLKINGVAEWVGEFLSNSDSKLVLFAIHKETISGLRQACRVKSVTVDGSTDTQARKRLVDQFKADRNTRLFIGNIRAAGTGIDGLQHATDTVAFCELPWRPGDLTQAEDRVWRMGLRSKTAWMYYLIAHNTIEEKLCQAIQDRQSSISAVIDGGQVDGDLDIFDRLLVSISKVSI